MLRVIRTRSGFTFFLLSLVIIGIFLRTTGRLRPVEDVTYPLFEPIQMTLLNLARGFGDRFSGFQQIDDLRAQVKQLEQQLSKTTVDQVRMTELEIENSQLREQLGYKQANPDYVLLGGTILEHNPDLSHVLGEDPSNLLNFVTVDQGSADGVAVGMPAVTDAGLVGRVSEVGTRWARVLLIIDPSSSVNAVVQSTRATGVIQGQLGGLLLMRYLPQGDSVKVNDLILTSGIGGAFPKRLVIGQVVSVQKRDTDLFLEALVKPSVDFNRLEFVLVIKKFTPTDITTEPTPTPTKAATPTLSPSATPTAGAH